MTDGTDRRTVLTGFAAGAALAALPGTARAGSCGPPTLFPNAVVWCHDGSKALFYNDLIRGKTVMLHFLDFPGEGLDGAALETLAGLAKLRESLGGRAGRDVFLYTIVSGPQGASPHALAALAERFVAGPGWLFLGGEPVAVDLLRGSLFVHDGHPGSHVHGSPPVEDCSRGLLRYGNEPAGLWGAVPARTDPGWLAERIAWISPQPHPQAQEAPRRRGPARLAPVRKTTLAGVCLAALLLGRAAPAQHPHMQPELPANTVTTTGDTTTVVTGASLFPPSFPFLVPPGTNFLPTVYTNLFDVNGVEMPNTLPSTPAIPYNLLDGDPAVSEINQVSPTDDLQLLWSRLSRAASQPAHDEFEAGSALRAIDQGIDILEGNPVPNRAYSGLPLLHFDGPDKVRKVRPVLDDSGKQVGGEVHIHQVWYDNHIESDTSLLDPSAVLDVPWTIVYTVDVLSRGRDDFSPFVMYFDGSTPPKPGAGMDQTFFPMQDGTRTVFRVKMTPGRYFNLSYTWGWRWHPPRVQVTENATKRICTQAQGEKGVNPCPTLVDWEVAVFGPAPRSSEQAKLAAIAKIGDVDPAKRMWAALRAARDAVRRGDWRRVAALAGEGSEAFADWKDRTHLPSGLVPDTASDLTLLYVNNTLYGQFADGGLINFPRWQTRGTTLKVTVYNGDNFEHSYQNVDFGGGRGWENQFKSSVKVAGSGCWFTFGRVYWWMNLPGNDVITVPAAQNGKLGLHRFNITYNYDPSRRLRFYQFDPLHHDVAIFSVH